MWELLARVVWLPFEIMHHISQRFYVLGTRIYRSGIGISRPALNPPPSPPFRRASLSSPERQPRVSGEGKDVEDSRSEVIVNDKSSRVTPLSYRLHEQENQADQQRTMNMNTPGIMSDSMAFAGRSELEDNATKKAIEPAAATNNENGGKAAVAATIEVVNEQDESRTLSSGKRYLEIEKRTSCRDDVASTSTSVVETCVSGPKNKKQKLSKEVTPVKIEESFIKFDQNSDLATLKGDKCNKSKKSRSKKNKKGQQSTEDRGEMGESMRPNYFIAIQISNKDILSKVAQTQKSFTEKTLSPPWHNLTTTEIFKDAMIPIAKLHFTLHVMHLKGPEEVERARNALKECWSEVHKEFTDDPVDLAIEGLGHFRNSVIYAQIKDEQQISRLEKLCDLVRKKLDHLQIVGDSRPFKPHMTIAKISRSNKLHKKKIRSFPPDIWSECEQTYFGTQRVNGIQLLCMAGEDKLTGYYRCVAQYSFHDPLESSQEKEPIINCTVSAGDVSSQTDPSSSKND